jgi:hypothetical protein
MRTYVFEICNTSGRGWVQLHRHPISKEGYFWGKENTLGWVQNDTVGLELGKEGMEELVVLLGRTAEDSDISKLKKQKSRTFTNLL